MTEKDIRIFYNNRTSDWIITNDFKMRRLVDQGLSIDVAKKKSHGHLNRKIDAENMKENILANKREQKRDLWILGCYVRLCDKHSYKHYKWIKGLYETRLRKGRKENFFRVNKGLIT